MEPVHEQRSYRHMCVCPFLPASPTDSNGNAHEQRIRVDRQRMEFSKTQSKYKVLCLRLRRWYGRQAQDDLLCI